MKVAIQTVQTKNEQLKKEIIQLKDERIKEWNDKFEHLKHTILNQ